MKKYKIGIVGIGAVGGEIVKILRQRRFPAAEIRILARSARTEIINGESFEVQATTAEAFDGLDFALFAGTEGAKGASQQFGWDAVKRGVTVIDNGDDFRMDDRVPLVIPEVNGDALKQHNGFIANPNCSTIIALMALAPLHRRVPIRRVIAATYQSVSGTGRSAVEELDLQARAYPETPPEGPSVYPHRIAFNLLPHIGGLKEESPGYTSEEVKLLNESRKILGAPDLKISSTCVRVPVFQAHAEALFVEFAQPVDPADARAWLEAAPGVRVIDDVEQAQYPMPSLAEGGDDVLVGRIRRDSCLDNGLALFVVGDNIRKGAALNAIQIAETIVSLDQGK